MIRHVLYFVVIAAVMLLLSNLGWLGFHVDGWSAALIAALVLALMNTVVKPILFLLTLPFTIVTLGLFLLVLNAITLWLTTKVVPGFHIDGAFNTFLGALALSLVGSLWKGLTKDEKRS
jgi:putative membrane protein